MEKSISKEKNKFYFDYNATTPFAQSVINWLMEGDYPFANPSSLHKLGRETRKFINQAGQYLLDFFGLGQTHDVFFHSGATEGLNTLLRGFHEYCLEEKKGPLFVFSPTDHACVTEVLAKLASYGAKCISLNVDQHGVFSREEFYSNWSDHSDSGDVNRTLAFMNYTYVNNETGVIWPLEWAEEIRTKTGCFVHVDAVQSPGRIKDFQKLSPLLDAYTFSGHKFGALKGIGFTFLKKVYPFRPLIWGGGQQKGKRSGTENCLGVHSLKLALEELSLRFRPIEAGLAKAELEERLKQLIGEHGQVIAEKAPYRNLNTITLAFAKIRSDILQTAFDMNGIFVSTGSACSSGVLKPNRIIKSMGYSDDLARGAIRLSFSPYLDQENSGQYLVELGQVIKKFL